MSRCGTWCGCRCQGRGRSWCCGGGCAGGRSGLAGFDSIVFQNPMVVVAAIVFTTGSALVFLHSNFTIMSGASFTQTGSGGISLGGGGEPITFALKAGAVATFSGPVSATPPVTLITASGATLRFLGSAAFPFGAEIWVGPDASWEAADGMKLDACITGYGTLNMNQGCLRSSSPAGQTCPKEAHCNFQTSPSNRRTPDARGLPLPAAESGAREVKASCISAAVVGRRTPDARGLPLPAAESGAREVKASCVSAAIVGSVPILDSCGTLGGDVVLLTGSIYVMPSCAADTGGHLSVTGSMTLEPGVRVPQLQDNRTPPQGQTSHPANHMPEGHTSLCLRPQRCLPGIPRIRHPSPQATARNGCRQRTGIASSSRRKKHPPPEILSPNRTQIALFCLVS